MGKITRRKLRSIILAVSLLAACTHVPAATQGPALVGQEVKDAVASTMDVFYTQVAQTQTAAPTATPTSEVIFVRDINEAAGSDPLTSETPTATLSPEEQAFQSYCEPRLETQVALGDVATINRLESNLQGKKTAVIQESVNLRRRPSLVSRIILILRPGALVDIIGGPVKTKYKDGTRYIWWQVQLRDQAKLTDLTGWVAELSACRQFRFMGLNTQTPMP